MFTTIRADVGIRLCPSRRFPCKEEFCVIPSLAIDVSIEKWKLLVELNIRATKLGLRVVEGSDTCGLCVRYVVRSLITFTSDCSCCPLYTYEGNIPCSDSPTNLWGRNFLARGTWKCVGTAIEMVKVLRIIKGGVTNGRK